ncbi:MAG: SMP-30/gluconolactonase/LRE family protein [Chloroflexi bacterium]|nr:SMP-30/gluconolactonase/LRE family protein [Chloroflexota bacterium]
MFALLVKLLRAVAPALLAVKGVVAALAAPLAPLAAGGVVGTAVTVGAVIVATATLGYGIYYVITGQPLVFAPAVPEIPVVGTALKALPPQYVFTITDVASPLGVAVSPGGERIYASESEGERLVRVFDREGRLVDRLAPPGSTAGGRLPVYVSVDRESKVYVTDRLRKSIEIFGPDGAYLGPFRPAGAVGLLPNPLGITLDRRGALYVTDVTPGNHRVLVLAANEGGRLLTAFGREGKDDGEFSYPNGLAVRDDTGDLYVADANNARILIFDAEGTQKGRLAQRGGASLGLPRGLALDSLGRLYVVDTVDGKVNVYDVRQEPAKFLFSFGTPGKGDGQLNYPNGVAVDSGTGRVYVADWGNNRVLVWAY